MYILPFLFLILPTYACTNDTNCITCNFYVVTLVPLAGYFGCSQCQPNRSYDQGSQRCKCNSHFYENSNGECSSCSTGCSTCTSSNVCTQCAENNARQLQNGQCVCMQEYEEVSGQDKCNQKTNVLMVVLSSVGSILCLIIGGVVCAVLRYRRNSQVHTEPSKKKTKKSENIEVEEIYEDDDQGSGVFFSSGKSEYFKQSQICQICEYGDTYFVTSCNHYFHGKCIYKWLDDKKKQSKCPTCDKVIQTKDIKRWCEKCRKVLMPVLKNVRVGKVGKKKKQVLVSTPVEHQICDTCENESESSVSQDKFST